MSLITTAMTVGIVVYLDDGPVSNDQITHASLFRGLHIEGTWEQDTTIMMSTSVEFLQLQLLEAIHAHSATVERFGIACDMLKALKKGPPQDREECRSKTRIEYFRALDALSMAHIQRCLLEARLQDALERAMTGAHNTQT